MIRCYLKQFIYGAIVVSSLTFYGCKKDVPDQQDPDSEQPGEPGQPDDPAHSSVADHWKSGDVFFDDKEWTECIAGDMPLVISAPHGGTLTPTGIPDRTCNNATTVTDLNTRELARAIEKELVEKYNVRPYLILCHLKRTKIDQNREINEATCGNPQMRAAWHQFHDYVDTAVSTAASKFGRAIYIDLHGHGHANQRLEIGYNLSTSELGKVYTSTNLLALAQKSSIQNLLLQNTTLSFQDLIMGEEAFGTLMVEEGFPSVPSKQDPYAHSGESYFNGGYNTRFYTSSDYPKVFGWQIECNKNGVRDNATSRAAFAKAFAKVIMQYLNQTKS